jgi:hypothetical protein
MPPYATEVLHAPVYAQVLGGMDGWIGDYHGLDVHGGLLFAAYVDNEKLQAQHIAVVRQQLP